MRTLRTLVVAALCAAALLAPRSGRVEAQEAPAPPVPPPNVVAPAEIEVRTDRTLVDPGRPVTNARAAFVTDGQGPPDVAANALEADGKGVIRAVPPRGGGVLLVWADGFAPVALRIDAPLPASVTLLPGRSLAVQVQANDGTALPAARVAAETRIPVFGALSGPGAWFRLRYAAESGRDGRARFGSLPESVFSVEARAPAFVPASVFPVYTKTEAVPIVLGRGARIEGRLRLIPDVAVTVVPATPAGAPREGPVARLGELRATVAADGAFAFDTVAPGTYELTFEGRGFAPPRPKTVQVAEGRNREGLVVEAMRTGALTGTIVVPTGVAVPPAVRLDLTWPPDADRPPRGIDVAPAADGTFRVDDLPAADGIACVVRAPGFVPNEVPGISIPPGGDSRDVRVPLEVSAIVVGALRDDDDLPIAGAVVGVRPATGGDDAPDALRAETDAEGRFRLDGAPPGEVTLRVLPKGFLGAQRFGPFVTVRGATTDVGALRVTGGLVLRGRVVRVTGGGAGESAGPPITVRVQRGGRVRAEVTLPATDLFEIRSLAAGDWLVEAVSEGEVIASEFVSLPAAWPVTLAVAMPCAVSGRVIDETGRPVLVATVRVERVTAGTSSDGTAERYAARAPGSVRTLVVREAQGLFETRLPAGRWRFLASDANRRAGSTEVDLRAGTGPTTVEIPMRPGTDVRGSAFEAATGMPLEGAVVRAVAIASVDPGGGTGVVAEDRVDDRGTFMLRGVPPGVVRVQVLSPRHPALLTDPIVVRLADAPDVGRLEVPVGVRIEGTVYGLGRAPLPGVDVEIETDAGTLRRATTDAYGRYVITDVEPGPARFRTTGEEASSGRDVRLRIPGTSFEWRHDIDVSRGTRLTGRVSTGGRDEPFARVRGTCSGNVVAAVADAFGRFALPPLPRGSATIEVTPSDGGAPWLTTIEIDGSVEQGIELAMPEGWVHGRVVASDGGEPLARARLVLRAPGGIDTIAEGRSAADGSFRLPRVPAGSYVLVATLDGYGTWLSDRIVVPQAAGVHDVTVELPPDCGVSMRVVDRELRPVSGGWLEARPRPAQGDRVAVRAFADPSGQVVLRGLRRGAWALAAGAPGFGRTDLGTFSADEGVQALGDAVLDEEAVLEVDAYDPYVGRVSRVLIDVLDAYDCDPRPLRRADDPLLGPDPLHATDAGGRLRIPGLAAGTYRVRVAGAPDAAEVRVALRPGRLVRILVIVPVPSRGGTSFPPPPPAGTHRGR